MFREELLCESQSQWRSDPADLHDGHEAGADGSSDLMEGPGSSDDGHGGKVYAVLDRRNLWNIVVRNEFKPDPPCPCHGRDVPQDC